MLKNSGLYYRKQPQTTVEFQHLWKVMDDLQLLSSTNANLFNNINSFISGGSCINTLTVNNINPCGSIVNVNGDLGAIGDIYANSFIGDGQQLLNVSTYNVTTYSQLLTDISLNQLKPGSYYYISDFATTFKLLPSGLSIDVTATNEPLLVQAISINEISPLAYSPLYPNDIIIYSVTDTTALAPANISISKGVILYRKDTIKNLETYYDWRSVTFRRWERTAGAGNFFWNLDPAPFVGSGGQAFFDAYTFFDPSGGNNTNCSIGMNTINVVCGDANSDILIKNNCGSLTGGGINIGSFNVGIHIDSNCATQSSASSFSPPGIYIGDTNIYITIGQRTYSIAIGNQCYAIKLGIQQSDIVVPNNTWRKRIEKGFSNFEATINITGLTQINLISNLSMQILSGDISGTPAYCGILNLTSTNSTETINEIIALPSSVSFAPYRLKPELGLTVSIIDKTVAGGSANIILNIDQLDINGTLTEYVIFDRYMLTLGNVTSDFHLEYTNALLNYGYVPYTGATNDVDLGTHGLTTDFVAFSQTPTVGPGSAQIGYNGATLALAYDFDTTNVRVNIGQQMYAYVKNDEAVTINKGEAVYLFGASGNKATVKLAYNTGDSTSATTLGLAAEDILAGQNGLVITQGVLDGLNTLAYSPGDILYLGNTAGSLTPTKPYAPNHLVYIGVVERSNAGNGQILVRPQNGYELDEIHDVDLITTPPSTGDVLTYNGTLWVNQAPASGGVSINNIMAHIASY